MSLLSPLPLGPNLTPRLIEFRSIQDADRVFISYFTPETPNRVDITFQDFGRAVDNAAWAFSNLIGARRSSSEPTKVVGILARSGAAYLTSIYALSKCGIVALLISPRNSREAIVNLLKLTNSVAVITDSFNRAQAEASAAELGSLPVYAIAPLPTPDIPAPEPFPFDLEWKEECDNPVVIIHTSGSTGLPKPVKWNSRFLLQIGFFHPEFIAKYTGAPALLTLPLFHGSAFAFMHSSFMWLGWNVVFPDTSKPVIGNTLVDICQGPYPPDIVIGAPSVIEEVTTIEGGMDVMRRRSWFFSGAPVRPHFGDFLIEEKIDFYPMLGSTETGMMNHLRLAAPELWQYHQLRPDLNIVLEPRGSEPGSGPFELIVLARDNWKPAATNVIINGIEGHSTSDLYQQHPEHPTLLKHCGRIDDVIVLANSEKTPSRPIEVSIEAHPHVDAAIVFGTGRTQTGVLVQPAARFAFDPSDKTLLSTFRDEIWPGVKKANDSSPSYAQIWKEMILVTSPDKPFPLTDKGTVRRKHALQLYSAEIDGLYRAIEELTSNKSLPTKLDAESLVPLFQSIIIETLAKPVGVREDVFALGMDALNAIFARKLLLSSLRADERTVGLVLAVPQNFFFLFVTPYAMASALANLVKTGHVVAEDKESVHVTKINNMVQKYTASFPVHTPGSLVDDTAGEVVILTGSTGSLGSFILDSLIHDNRVNKVFCFNKREMVPTLERQQNSFAERKLDSSLLTSDRIIFYDVEVNVPFFGLAEDVFKGIHNTATLIIHNAWALNLNWQLNAFEGIHIKGLRNIIDFALTSPRPTPPRVAFTSSILSTGAYTAGPVPEKPIDDPTVCIDQGYARSKFVGERILTIAAEKTGLQISCFRIAQISGDSKCGIWNATEHVPALFRGCQKLGVIPSDWFPVSWTSVDDVAHTIVDVVLDHERGTGTFHISNPHPIPWIDLMPAVRRMLMTRDDDSPLEVISMKAFVERLKDSNQSEEDNPAIKLITFFENDVVEKKGVRSGLTIDKTKMISPTLARVKPVDESVLRLFVDYWKSIGYLQSVTAY